MMVEALTASACAVVLAKVARKACFVCMLAAAQAAPLQSFAKDNSVAVKQWMRVDDFIFQTKAVDVHAVVAEYERACAEAGVELVGGNVRLIGHHTSRQCAMAASSRCSGWRC